MLIKEISEVNNWIPFNTFKDLRKIKAYLNLAELESLVPILGEKLYEYLQNMYDSGEHENDKATNLLLQYSQAIIVNFGIYKALPMLNITINQSGGLTVTVNENTLAASKDRSDKLAEGLLTQAHNYKEQLLLFLERESKRFINDKGEELWKQSPFYWEQTGCLIFTAKEFNNIVYINDSRLKFCQLYPAIKLIERTVIRPAFSDKLINRLIEGKMNHSLNLEERILLLRLQTALALLTIETDKDLSLPDTIHGEKNFDAKVMAENELSLARKFLKDHPDEYPEYPGNKAGSLPEQKKCNYMLILGGTDQ